MKNTQKIEKYFLIFFIFIYILFLCSCHEGPFTINNNIETFASIDNSNAYNVSINIKEKMETIKDCTPEFIIINDNKNIVSMSFSGDNKNWSEWVDFSEKYDQFNIASGLNGTRMESGIKTVYIRFLDINGNIFPLGYKEPIFCSFYYEMQTLFSIRIEPLLAEINPGGLQAFTVKGYDLFSKYEVPLDSKKVEWSKTCAVGKLEPVYGLNTTYAAPERTGIWNISVHYGSLGAGAKVNVEKE